MDVDFVVAFVELWAYLVNMNLALNVKRLVADLGGPSGLARYLTSFGFETSLKTVSSWQTRNSLPMEAWIRICEVVQADKGKRLNLWNYLEPKT